MKEWFEKLDPRERKVVIGGGVALTLVVIYFLMWEPFINSIDAMRKNNAEQQQLLAWMKKSANEVKQLRASNPQSVQSETGQSLLGLVDQTAKRAKLGPSIKRVKPEGSTKAHVWIEDASFNDLMRWLETLQNRHGIHIISSFIEKQDSSGIIKARLVFEGS